MPFLHTPLARRRQRLHRRTQRSTRRQQFFTPHLEALEDRRLLAVDVFGVPEWTEIGPRGIEPTDVSPHGVVTGAVQAIAHLPTNSNVVFVGTVNGGIWKTGNIDAAGGPVWENLTDSYPAQSISSLAFSPLGDKSTLFAGTGKPSSYVGFGNSLGILRGERTGDDVYVWTPYYEGLPRNAWISDVLPTAIGDSLETQIVIAGSRGADGVGGLHISHDGGASWSTETSILPQRTIATPGHVTDLMPHPDEQQPGQFFFAMISNTRDAASAPAAGVWRADWHDNNTPGTADDFFTYNQILGPDVFTRLGISDDFEDLTNIKLASQFIAGTTHLFVGLVAGTWNADGTPSSGGLSVVLESTDGGINWRRLGPHSSLSTLTHTGNGGLGQGHYHFSITADPTLAGIVYVGGDLPPNLWRFNGNDWDMLSRGATTSMLYPHADSRVLVFDRAGRLFEGDDGGIYRLDGPSSANPQWTNLNGNLGTVESVSVVYDQLRHQFVLGTQDNAVAQSPIVGQSWQEVVGANARGENLRGGDGRAQEIAYPSDTSSVLYSMRNNFASFSRHVFTATTTGFDEAVANVPLRRAGRSSHLSGLSERDRIDQRVAFRPMSVNAVPSAASQLLLGGHGLYESFDRGDTIRPIGDSDPSNSNMYVALAYGGYEPGPSGSRQHPEVIYAGRRNALFVRGAKRDPAESDDANPLVKKTPHETVGGVRHSLEFLTDIAVHPRDWRIAYVAEKTAIWRTEDGGDSWRRILKTDSLAGSIWSLALAVDAGREVLFLGTDNGVYRAIAPDAPQLGDWSLNRFGWNLPNVPVLDVRYYPIVRGGMLVAGTLGRGTWLIEGMSVRLTQVSRLQVVGVDPESTGDDRFRLQRDAHNPLLLEVYVNGEQQPFRTGVGEFSWSSHPWQIPVSAIQTIEVLGGAGNDWLRIDSSHGPITSPVTFNGQGGDDNQLRLFFNDVGSSQVYASYEDGLHSVQGSLLGSPVRQLVQTQNVTRVLLEGPLPGRDDPLAALNQGLNRTGDVLRSDALTNTQLPLLGQSLGHVLDGQTPTLPRPLGSSAANAPGIQGPLGGGATTLFRRMIETGPYAFALADIGTDRIPTLDDLRQRLDDLDNVPNNVVLNPRGTAAGTTLLDVKIVDKTLTGVADLLLDTELLGGTVNIAGLMGLQADVTMHLRVGVDDRGFFIDPGNNPDPEFVVRNLRFNGNASAQGQFGIVDASLSGVSLQFDEDIRIAIDLHDPGAGMVDDGYIRLDGPGLFDLSAGELTDLTNDLMSISVDGGGSGRDVTLTGTFSVAPLVPGSDTDPFSALANAEITLVWPDLAELTNVQVDLAATSSLGQQFLQLLHVSVDQVATGLRSLGPVLEQIAATPVMSSRLPLLGRSLNQVLQSAPSELLLSAAAGRAPSVSEVVERDGYHTFEVIVEDLAFPAEGVAAGDRIYVRPAAGSDPIEATIAFVELGHLTVQYAATNPQLPDRVAPELRIVRQGALSRRLEAMLSSLTGATAESIELPTFQELAHRLADLVDVDLAELPIALRTDPLALEWTLPLELEPLEYRQPLNFDAGLPGLSLRSDGAFVFAVAPNMQLTVGMLLEPSGDIPLSERFYVAEGSQVTLQVDAQVTGSGLTGSLGFVDLLVGTQQLQLTGTVGARLSGPVGNPTTPIRVDPLLDARLDAVLPVSIDVGGDEPIEMLTVEVHHALSTTDDFAAVASSVGEQLASLADYSNITPQMVAQALSALVGQLRRLGLGPVLDAEIPLINQSLADLANLGDTVADLDGLSAESVGTVKRLAQVLGAERVAVTPQEVRFHFRRDSRFVHEIPLAFGVGADFDLLSLSGEGTLQVEARADGQLALGISTAPGIAPEDRFFLLPQETQFVMGAAANVGYDVDNDGIVDTAPLSVRAHALGIPVEISDARALLRIAGQASLADRNDGAGDDTEKLTLRELAAGGFDARFVPTEDHLQAILPLDAGPAGIAAMADNQFDPADLIGTGDAVVEILGRLSDLPGGLHLNDSPVNAFHTNVTQLVTPGVGDAIAVQAWNLDAFVSEGILSFDSLLSGLTQLVEWTDALLGTDVLDYKLPFINRSLRDGLNFVGTVGATCAGDPDTLGDLVTCMLATGAGGTMPEAAEALAKFLADEGAIEPLGDLNGDAKQDWQDILQIEGDPAEPTSVTFQFRFAPTFDPFGATWHGFDLGTDLLTLKSAEGLSVSFQPNLTMLIGFGVDQNGFFIKTDFDEPEIQMDATLQLQGDARLKLGFVEVGARFDDNDRLSVQLSADLADGTTGKVRLSDLLNVHRIERIVDASALAFHVEAGLNVPLELKVDAAGFKFNALEADLVVDWVPVSTSETTDGDPTIELRNVRVPVGEWVNDLGGNVLEQIRNNNPLAPLLDVLNEDLPVLGKSLLELFQDENEGLTQNAVWQLLATGNSIADLGNFELSFGDVLFERGSDGTLQKLPAAGSAENGFHDGTPLADAVVPGGNLPGVIGEAITSAAENLGITFPILKLSNILNFLVFEKDVDLVRFEFPVPLQIPILAAYDTTIGSFGIPKLLSVSAGMEYNVGLSFVVDLALGFDTRGLRSDREKLATSFGILDGLWIGDFDPNLDGDIVPGGIDRPEIRLEGAIEGAIFGSAEVAGFDLGRVRGSASIAAGIGIDLNDDNALHGEIDNRSDEDRYDGKFHLDEMALVLADHSHAGHDAPFLCLFDLTGSITAALGIDVKIDLLIKTLKKRFEKNWTLLRFEVGCDATPPPIAALNGRMLELRGTPEPDHFEIELTLDNMLRVTQDGQSLEFVPANVDFIVGDLGDGSDIVFVDSAVTTPVILSGGLGDDELTAGAGGGRLLGGPGNDTLTTAELSASVVIVGGGDDDYLRGGSSADELVGDYHPTFDPRPEVDAVEGSDTILGGPGSTWSGTDYPADDTDLIWGDNAAWNADGPVPDVGNFTDDIITIEGGAARVWAGAGDDFLSVGTGRVTAYGGVGDDTMRGGDEADLLVGGAGNDTLFGGAGNDQLFGGSYFDPAQPHPPVAILLQGDDQLDGGDGDDLLDGFDSTYVRARGGEGNDLLIGSQGSDELRGGNGDDVVFAGPGSDLVRGGSGNDVILGGSGTIDNQTLWPNFQSLSTPPDRTDRLFGDAGDDIILGDNGRVRRWTNVPTTSLVEYHTEVIAQSTIRPGLSDLIVGGTGDDLVLGGDDSDLIYGDSDFVYFQGALPRFTPASAPGHDVLLGDNGEFVRRISYERGALFFTTHRIVTTGGAGRGDTILGDDRALAASGGFDMIFGGEGGDFIWGSGGGDTILGDHAQFQEAWRAATGFVDRQVFSIAPTLGGDDTIDGGAGIDGIVGGFGHDQLWGGDDTDVVLGDHGRIAYTATGAPGRAHALYPDMGGDDQLVGGSGTDFVIGGFGRDTLWGGDGNDPNYLFGDNATIVFADGSPQAHTLSTGFDEYGERDTIYGGDGPDYIIAGLGHDIVYGQGGNDQVLGEFGTIVRDELGAVTAMYPLAVLLPVGAQTNDILWGGPGNDLLHGDYGDDVVRGEDGDDIMSGGVGNDWVAEVTNTFLILSDTQLLGRGVDQLDSFERGNLIGDGHDNLLDAQFFSGPVISAGFGGNDTLIGGRSDDTLDGGDQNDILIGGAGDDYLLGRDGNDQLDGGTGHDRIDGGAGDDTHYALFGTGMRPTGLYHTWTVSTTADSGAGSLRWAIENSTTLPADVLVVIPFQIPATDPNYVDVDAASGGDAAGDVHVIAPAIELPSLSRGNVIVNGLSRAFGDTADPNPAGPDIVLDGRYELLTGLALASGRNQVYGLNLQRFLFAGLNVVGHENVIAANYMGTDPTASELRWNAQFGIQLNNASGNRIGLPGLGNVIGGNAAVGVLLTGDASSNNVLHDNSIGTDPTGTRALGNGGPGIVIMGAAPSGNVIGGLLPGEGNRIAFNHGEGIYVSSSGERGTSMRGNAIYSNDELGIDLADAGVTENDSLDADAGANRLQNFPVVTFATMGPQLRVAGTFHSAPLRQYTLDFYASDEADPSGYGEGQRYVGSVAVVTDAAGDARFDDYLPGAPGAAQWITATATEDRLGDTSEFSLAHPLRDVSDIYIVTNTNDSGPGSLRAAIEWANGVTTDGPATIEFAIPANDARFVDVDADLAGGDPDPDIFVVMPLSPLPALTRGNIAIAGPSQQGLTGDTNPFGPEIVLAGQLAGPEANGLELRSAENRILGLNIQGFGGNGILLSDYANTVTGNYIGTDPTGNFATQSPPGLVSLWSAEGNAEDTTGKNHGTLVNGTSFAPGRSGQAFRFDGVDDYVATPLVVDYTSGATFELWVSSLGDGGNTLMAGGGGATRDRGMGLFLEGGRPLFAGMKGTAGIPNFALHPNLSITDGQFHHLVGTWTGDTTPDGVKLYLDGQLVGSTTAQISVPTDGTPLYLGDHPAYYLPFRGLIDQAAVYARVLTEQEVAARFRAPHLNATANGASGISIVDGAANVIGGTSPSDRNIISGNDLHGVHIIGNGVVPPLSDTICVDPATGVITSCPPQIGGNTVLGNFIGTTADGMRPLGNSQNGVFVEDSALNLIGGTAAGAGNVIADNTAGVTIFGPHASDNRVQGNLVGLAADGETMWGNRYRGVSVIGGYGSPQGAPGNVVGGAEPSAGNVISGSPYEQLFLAGTRGTVVQGNLIGTNAAGTATGSYAQQGIRVEDDLDSLIGGTRPGEGNLISSSYYGIYVNGRWIPGGTQRLTIQGNRIGTDRAGERALANFQGIYIDGYEGGDLRFEAHDILVGGTEPGAGNLISGNQTAGIIVRGPNLTGIQVQGNSIGTRVDGLSILPNGTGLIIDNALGIVIGGYEPGAGNVIAGHFGSGIAVSGGVGNLISGNRIAQNEDAGITVTGAATGNTIRQNSIFDNGGLGIDLGDDGVTTNDNGNLDTGVVPDLDLGPNSLQNFPELQSVQPGLTTRVTGQLRSTPGQSFVLDFYASAAADPTGFGEGQRWLGSTTVMANEEGVARYNATLAAATFGGEFVTATATRLQADGSESDTSEFSAAFAIKAGKGVRGPDRFTLEFVPSGDSGASVQRLTPLDVVLTGALDPSDAFTPIDVAAFTTSISRDPAGPIGLPVSLATNSTSYSPWLMEVVSRGTPFAQAVLVGQSTIDEIPYEFARWTLDDVRLGSFANRDFAQDEFTLVYDRLAYTYTPLTKFGAPGTPIEGVWDVTATGGVVPVTLPEHLAQPTALTDVQYFVEIPGIQGDTTLVGYAGWIESRSVDFALLGADVLAGTPAFAGTIGVLADAGSASPRLMEAVANGSEFAAPIKIAAVRTIANEVVEFARWELDGASLVSYASASGRLDGFAITFDALHYSFSDSGPDGQLLPPHSATLNRSEQGIDLFARGVRMDAVTPASDAKTLLARIPGAPGESQLQGYAGWTPVRDFEFLLERPLTASGDAGAPFATSFSILMPTGSSSPRLFELAASGTVLSEPIQVALVESVKNDILEFSRWTLSDAEIGDYATVTATQDAVTVGYDQLTYQSQRPTIKGGMSPPIVGQWNAAAAGSQPYNTPLDPRDDLVLTNEVRLFVEFPGITGDGQAVGYVGWVPVGRFEFDLTNPLDIAGSPALASAFRFSARSGQASPQLQRALLEGQTFADVNVVAVRQSNAGKLEEFARWKLRDAQVASYATNSLLEETFEVSFDALEYRYGVVSTKKGAPTPVTGRWDLQASGAEVAIRGSLVPDAVIPSDVQVLMQVPGIVGASQLVGYQDWIPLQAAGLTLARRSTPSQDVVLVSTFGIATSAGLHSPLVVDALARQRVYADDAPVRIVTLNMRDQTNIYETARWTLSDAQFTAFANQDLRQDAFVVAYDAWDLVYTPSTSQGTAGTPIHLEWDVDGTITQLTRAGSPLASPAASADIKLFLRVPGIVGDSLRVGYVGWIPVAGADFGLEQQLNETGQSWATPVSLQMRAGLSAPPLMAAVAGGVQMPYVELVALHDPSSFEIARLRLEDIQWTHFVTRDAQHNVVAFTYDRLSLTWNEQNLTGGSPSATAEGHWPAVSLNGPSRSADSVERPVEPKTSVSAFTAETSAPSAPDPTRGWTAAGGRWVNRQYQHTFVRLGESITIINDAPWQNPINPLDANGDGFVSPRDALLIINYLQAVGTGPLAADGPAAGVPAQYLDVTGSSEWGSAYVSPLDALRIINALSRHDKPEGESAIADPASSPFVPADMPTHSGAPSRVERVLFARTSDAADRPARPTTKDAMLDWLVPPLVDAGVSVVECEEQARRTDAALLELWDEVWDNPSYGMGEYDGP